MAEDQGFRASIDPTVTGGVKLKLTPIQTGDNWHSYYWQVLKCCGAESYRTWRGEMLASVVIAIAAFILTAHDDPFAAKNLQVALLATAIGLAVMGLWHLVRSPWVLQKRTALNQSEDDAWGWGLFGLLIVIGIIAGIGYGSMVAYHAKIPPPPSVIFPVPPAPRMLPDTRPNTTNANADELKKAQQEAQSERDNARHWREAYEGVSRGDLHPDRHLDREDRHKLREQLETIARDPRNKELYKLDFGMAPDNVEAQHLGWQLYQLFRDSHWDISRPTTEVPKELQAEFQKRGGPNYASGIFVFADNRDRGNWIASMLYSCCHLGVEVNPGGSVPQGFKGILLWVGAKYYQTYRDDD